MDRLQLRPCGCGLGGVSRDQLYSVTPNQYTTTGITWVLDTRTLDPKAGEDLLNNQHRHSSGLKVTCPNLFGTSG